MIAKDLLQNKPYEVKKYNNVLYIELDSGYMILEKTNLKLEQIEYGHLYSFYKINDEPIIYDSFYSTEYKCFTKQHEQLALF